MFSGISGLRTHQQRMDVIGNDIANVNTIGYKQSDVTFKEAYVNTLRFPAPGSPGLQVGLGTQMGSIVRDFSGGILMETGQASNMGISGEGFFVVAEPVAGGANYFTRAGDFLLDMDPATGRTYVINPDGKRLRGVLTANLGDPAPDMTGKTEADLVDLTLPAGTTSFTIGVDGVIYASVNGAAPAVCGRVAVATFDNTNGLGAIGNNLYVKTDSANIHAFTNPGSNGCGQVFQGYLENSNVDLAREFTDMIITQRGFQANSKSITTSDEMLIELLQLKR
jgi:flagellar hook protein FlgE